MRDVQQDLCSSIAGNGPSEELSRLIRNTTSEMGSDPSEREAAAKAAWNVSAERLEAVHALVSINPSNWLTIYGYGKENGYTVTVSYADGGTEQFTFRYNSGNGDLVRKEGTLKPGTGQSKCPK